MKYRLLMYAKEECIIVDKINAEEVVKSLKLFRCRHSGGTHFKLYEYSANADCDEEYFEVLYFFN